MIRRLFPKEVHTASGGGLEDWALLYLEEQECVRNAVPMRRREFAQGRLLARQAFARFGIRDFPLLVGTDRAPIWPDNLVGSITHCSGYCGVAVAQQRVFAGVGLDAEGSEPVDQALIPMICTPPEISWLESVRAGAGRVAKLIFSAKESIFKCVYPMAKTFLDFHDCRIELDLARGTFAATILRDDIPVLRPGARLSGHFAHNRSHLFTGVTVLASELGSI